MTRLRERLRHAARELAAAGQDVGVSLGQQMRACTCGNPRRTGPCPRHGTHA